MKFVRIWVQEERPRTIRNAQNSLIFQKLWIHSSTKNLFRLIKLPIDHRVFRLTDIITHESFSYMIHICFLIFWQREAGNL